VNPLVKWSAIAFGALASVVLVAVIGVYVSSNIVLAKAWPMPKTAFRSPQSATVAEGAHLASTLGCTNCHGAKLEGQFLDFIPASKVYGPNLVQLAKTFSDSDFEHAIRQGVKPDGSSVIVMPSNMLSHLSDRELGSLVKYIRSIKSDVPQVPEPQYGLMVRAGLVLGKFSTQKVLSAQNKAPVDLGPQFATGRHIAMTACTECHASSLEGENSDMLKTPDLMVAAAYERADFLHFMKTGKAVGDRELPLMSDMARIRFSHFTDAEANALYDYLQARGQKIASAQ
jgi:cytochrome c553